MRLVIGGVGIVRPYLLAPLAGYSDLPFRLLCREQGAGLCVSEMISCHGLVYRQAATWRLVETHHDERPVAIQLFGAEPEIMGEAAAMIADCPIDIIDINMGCPVRKVIKKGAGAALMREPKRAAAIIRACVAAGKPVTVKFRSGWNHERITAPEFARMAEEEGAAAVTVHGRTWSDGFGGSCDQDVIRRVRAAVSIPVIGNGDVHSIDEAQAMMAATGCHGVMIGRAALGAPWVFSHQSPAAMPLAARAAVLARHLALIERFYEPGAFLGKVKNHACRYFKGVAGSAAMRKAVFDCPTFHDLTQYINEVARSGHHAKE